MSCPKKSHFSSFCCLIESSDCCQNKLTKETFEVGKWKLKDFHFFLDDKVVKGPEILSVCTCSIQLPRCNRKTICRLKSQERIAFRKVLSFSTKIEGKKFSYHKQYLGPQHEVVCSLCFYDLWAYHSVRFLWVFVAFENLKFSTIYGLFLWFMFGFVNQNWFRK